MRDPARIDRICELLRKAWHRSPDLRLGQLVNNVIGLHSQPFAPSLVHVEDDVAESKLARLLERDSTTALGHGQSKR